MPVDSTGEIHETHLKVSSVLALLQSQKMVSGTLRKEHGLGPVRLAGG
jgi:hypothetical protein